LMRKTVFASHKSRQCREGETRKGRDVQVDHGLEVVDVCVQ
jgi:hypothetical protein